MSWTTLSVKEDTHKRFTRLKKQAEENEEYGGKISVDEFMNRCLSAIEESDSGDADDSTSIDGEFREALESMESALKETTNSVQRVERKVESLEQNH